MTGGTGKYLGARGAVEVRACRWGLDSLHPTTLQWNASRPLGSHTLHLLCPLLRALGSRTACCATVAQIVEQEVPVPPGVDAQAMTFYTYSVTLIR